MFPASQEAKTNNLNKSTGTPSPGHLKGILFSVVNNVNVWSGILYLLQKLPVLASNTTWAFTLNFCTILVEVLKNEGEVGKSQWLINCCKMLTNQLQNNRSNET